MITLFLTHTAKQCGVKAHGNRFVEAMAAHSPSENKWIVCEVSTMDQIRDSVWYWKPDVTILNFHPSTIPKLEPELNFSLKTKFVALPHENLTIEGIKNFKKSNTQFVAALWQDVTANRIEAEKYGVYVIPRCIPKFFLNKRPDRRDIPEDNVVVKMFGFGNGGKRPEDCVKAVEDSFEKATIIGHFSSNEFTDPYGFEGEKMIQKLRDAVTKPGIQVLRSKEMYCGQYMSENDLIQWLSDSDINLSMHQDDAGTGISSTTDLMMAAGIPFAVNDSSFYRHLPEQIKLKHGNTLKDIMNAGIDSWKNLAVVDWSPKQFSEEVNNVLKLIISRYNLS